ncbi:acid sugar phosphatase [Bacteroidia bacterium]|nr:acid sugar phosphatase [Bacteroidia bacterium]
MKDLRQIKHVALDMDGTIYNGSTLFPFTVPFLEQLTRQGIGYSFLTNNPSRSTTDYMQHLQQMGIPASREQMYTSTQATIGYLKAKMPAVKRLFLLGTPSMIAEFEAAGFAATRDDSNDVPDAIVAAFDKTLVYSRLCRAAWWVQQGLPYLATNPDRVCPTDQPTVLVDCGAICACIAYATGRHPDVVIGKPDPRMLDGILAHYHLQPAEVAIVGDRLYTDVQTALNANAIGILVLSGETTPALLAASDVKPDLVVRDLEELGEMMP